MAFWKIDLTTRIGAREAASTGATAAYIYAGVSFFGALLGGALLQQVGKFGQTAFDFGPIMISVLALFAGFRLKDGKGLVLGSLLALIVALGLLMQLATLAIGGGTAISLVVLVLLIQGMRGAWTLHKGQNFEDDDVAAFE